MRWLLPLLLLLGCATGTARLRPDQALALRHRAASELPPEMPVAPSTAERLLREGRFTVEAVHETTGGVTKPQRLTLRFPGREGTLDFKWKAAPADDSDGWNNTPRRELAAYQIQKWFLAPEEYVVPPTAGVCMPLGVYAAVEPAAQSNVPAGRCVFGVLALWLQDVDKPDVLLDPERFLADPLYARHLAQLNLFTHLIDHRDSHTSNVLASRDADGRRFFSVDNGLAFGAAPYNFLVRHWNRIRVPGVPDDAIRRLMEVGPKEVLALGVVAQYELDPEGQLRPVTPGPNLDPARGTRRVGNTLQLGLTEEEIDGLADRLEELLDDATEGEIPVF
jgi:hypothetical protein